MTPKILGSRIDPTSHTEAIAQILSWARKGESRYVCVANVHMVMEAYDHADYQAIVNAADLVVPDGMPLVWMLRRLKFPNQERVSGPDLMAYILQAAAKHDIPVGFYGSTPEVLNRLQKHLKLHLPILRIAYLHSPPFRPLTPQEDTQIVTSINSSGVRILFVGLGCPKQERWMANHKGRVKAVMIGVGAAFEFHAGTKRRAPHWMQHVGLEWLYRLLSEPKRLWRRYLYHNPRFLVLALQQLWKTSGWKRSR